MKYFYLVLTILILGSCGPVSVTEPKEETQFRKRNYERKVEIVAAKTIHQTEDDVDYVIAFESGFTKYVTFGIYTYYKVGDKVEFDRCKGCYSWDVTLYEEMP